MTMRIVVKADVPIVTKNKSKLVQIKVAVNIDTKSGGDLLFMMLNSI